MVDKEKDTTVADVNSTSHLPAILNLSSTPSTPSLSSPSEGDSSDECSASEERTDSLEGYRKDHETVQNILLRTLREFEDGLTRRRFFPNTTFTELMTDRVVDNELRDCYKYIDPPFRRMLTRRICGTRSFKKIFALLALVEKTSEIRHFIEQDIADDDLPLAKIPLHSPNLFKLGCLTSNTRDSITPLNCFDGWSAAAMRIFEDWQWSTLAPTFPRGERKNIRHLKIPDSVPLPFTSDVESATGPALVQGGHSTVFKAVIHPAHHCFDEAQNMYDGSFAVKRLFSGDRAQFEREAEMLATFSGEAHPNIISLLATYEQHGVFHLVFPWADADLQSFWRDIEPTPALNHETVIWVAEQSLGLAKGLSALHQYTTNSASRLTSVFGKSKLAPECSPDARTQGLHLFGLHGDIKPQNVLWFRHQSNVAHRGTLKLSDFGLSRFKTRPDETHQPSLHIALSVSYRPPEYDCETGTIGRSHDIWALGCLYLEMIAWCLGGWQLLNYFQARRTASATVRYNGNIADAAFFQIESRCIDGTATVKIKQTVIEVLTYPKRSASDFLPDLYPSAHEIRQFIDHLRSLPTCTAYFHTFLHLVETEMIIIKPRKHEEKGRIAIAELVGKLNQMWQGCKCANYATMPLIQRNPKRIRDEDGSTTCSQKLRRF